MSILFDTAAVDEYTRYGFAFFLGAIAGLAARSVRSINRPASIVQKSSHWRYVLSGGLAGIVTLFLAGHFGWSAPDWNWLVVGALGAAVAVGELASRYRDEPTKAIFSLPAGIYVLLNAGAAMLALEVGRSTMHWSAAGSGGQIDWTHVLQAGLGQNPARQASIAAGSALTELISGRDKATLKTLTTADIENAVGGLSNESKHAAALCLDAVRALLTKFPV